jgi:hypothetical protein
MTKSKSTESANGRPKFDAWLAETVKSLIGRPLPPGSVERLGELLAKRLPPELKEYKYKINRFKILEELREILRDRMTVLRDAAAARVPAPKVLELLKRHALKGALIPPLWVVEELLQEMHGRVKAPHENLQSALSGITRLPFMHAKERVLEKTSFAAPYHALKDVKSDQLKIAVISGLQFGLPFDPDIYRNLTRCGFSAARKQNCDAIVVGGGLLHMELKKRSSWNRLVDDMLSGADIDIESFAEDYKDEVRKIVESESLDPIFQTAEEQLKDLLRGLYKVLRRPRRDGPGTVDEFKKPVYVILNPDDLKVPLAAAHFHLLYKQMQRWLEANAVARKKAKEVAMYEKLLNSDTVTSATEKDLKDARAEAAKATAMAARFRISNLHKAQNKKVLKRAISYIVEKIEQTIPNAVVIAHGGAHMRFGTNKQIIEFISSDRSVHINELKSFGPKQRKGKLPALTVSMHPGAAYPRKGSRENYMTTGQMLGTASFVEAPILVDRQPILEALEGMPSKLPVFKAVIDPMFVGGMLTVSLDSRFMPNADVLPVEAVRTNGQPQASRAPAKMVWLMIATDPHLGAANRLWLRNDLGSPIGITEAGLELMSRSGVNRNGLAHVCGITFADDLTQGNHFGTHLRPHHNQRTNAEMQDEVEDALRKLQELRSYKQRSAEQEKLIHELEDQLVRFRPPHHWGTQLKEFWRAILDKNEHVFKGMLLRAKESGVIVKGVSKYTGFPVDARDVGLINFGSGNHATKTLDSSAFEGEIISDRLWVALRSDPDLKGLDLRALICGPMFQDQSIGFGTLQIGEKGPKWGLHIAGTPPKRNSWYDLMSGWVAVNRQRGNISTILNNMPILHMTGDKHFFGFAMAGDDIYVMGPSSTHTDAFADIAGGLPENTPGLAFVGLPVEGPDRAGPSVVHLTPEVMQKFLTSGEPFPWEDFLPNRA